MKTYCVTFHYTVEVQADDQEQADEQAWQVFAGELSGLSAGDFCGDEPEEMWWKNEVTA